MPFYVFADDFDETDFQWFAKLLKDYLNWLDHIQLEILKLTENVSRCSNLKSWN